LSSVTNDLTAEWDAPTPPKPSGRLAWGALGTVLAVLALAAVVFWQLRALLEASAVNSLATDLAMLAAIAVMAGLFWPAARALGSSSVAGRLTGAGDIMGARVEAAASRDWSMITFGYAAAAVLVIGAVAFFSANNAQVSRTFVDLPLIWRFWGLVAYAFLTNITIFVVAEILVLIWGLMVAIARMLPGEAGRPLRFLAMTYCDIFRGFPAIITIYLVGFGIPLAGIPYLGDMPKIAYAIFALTLVYGAYVAEVYRSGIESVHWSQTAAARSLGLSYFQALRYVIVPQAVRRIMPPLLNDFIGLQKDTALVMVIGVLDAFNQSRIIASNHFNLSAVTIVGILFVLITIPQARFVDRLVEHDQRRTRAGS
jgi:polar amino acid transport system permease protein